MQKVLVIGASGGIGSCVCVRLSAQEDFDVIGWTSQDLDLDCPERIFDCDFSDIDILINCAGHNQGSYQGFVKNSWQNQLSQINVNYISNLFLLKHFAQQRNQGKYVWLSSVSVDNPRIFHSTYLGTKVASKFSIDLIAQEIPHITVLEAKIGLTRSKIRYRNFSGTKTWQQVQDTYQNEHVLECDYVAEQLILAIQNNLTQTEIT